MRKTNIAMVHGLLVKTFHSLVLMHKSATTAAGVANQMPLENLAGQEKIILAKVT